jgi:15-cis-phytoene synthase
MSELAQNRQAIQKGSKSFSLASHAFAAPDREAAWSLYAWCRFADDQVDEAGSPAAASAQLALLGATLREESPGSPFPWPGFKRLMAEKNIPRQYPEDLLRGFEMDLGELRIRDEGHLLDYCYCVAGTVGLMMSHIVGLKSPHALRQAVALGQAMQLTNIARDVKEDFARGRIYLPQTWLAASGVDSSTLFAPEILPRTKAVVDQLLFAAESKYVEGRAGLSSLPFRAAIAVGAALAIYREIGRVILHSPPEVLMKRVVISKPRKIFLFLLALGNTVASLPARWWKNEPARNDLPLWRPL